MPSANAAADSSLLSIHDGLEGLLKRARTYQSWQIGKQFVASVAGGVLVTLSGVLATFFSSGFTAFGAQALLASFGFTIGFTCIVLSGAALYTEVNTVLPTIVAKTRTRLGLRTVRFWGLVFVGNFLGAMLLAIMLRGTHSFPTIAIERLQRIIDAKNSHISRGTSGWFETILSGMLANWLVSLATFFSSRCTTLPGKFIGILLAITAFVTLGVQHAPANMGFMMLGLVHSEVNVSWGDAIWWNIIPAGIGNAIGAVVFVVLPTWYLYHTPNREDAVPAHAVPQPQHNTQAAGPGGAQEGGGSTIELVPTTAATHV